MYFKIKIKASEEDKKNNIIHFIKTQIEEYERKSTKGN